MNRLIKTFEYEGEELTFEYSVEGMDIYANLERNYFLIFKDDRFLCGFCTDAMEDNIALIIGKGY